MPDSGSHVQQAPAMHRALVVLHRREAHIQGFAVKTFK
jgi:hypothetical protein